VCAVLILCKRLFRETEFIFRLGIFYSASRKYENINTKAKGCLHELKQRSRSRAAVAARSFLLQLRSFVRVQTSWVINERSRRGTNTQGARFQPQAKLFSSYSQSSLWTRTKRNNCKIKACPSYHRLVHPMRVPLVAVMLVNCKIMVNFFWIFFLLLLTEKRQLLCHARCIWTRQREERREEVAGVGQSQHKPSTVQWFLIPPR